MSTIRKMLLLTYVALAVAAFAVPAAAQAKGPFWYVDDEGGLATPVGGKAEKETFTGHGTLSFNFGGYSVNECGVDTHGYVWNGPERGEGEIDEVEFTAPCAVGVECEVKIHASVTAGPPWKIKLTSPDGVDFESVTLTFTYSKTCEPSISNGSISGTLTGTFPSGNCAEYSKSGDLFTEDEESTEVTVTGSLCMTAKNGEPITAK